jgi:hypothetical protein
VIRVGLLLLIERLRRKRLGFWRGEVFQEDTVLIRL